MAQRRVASIGHGTYRLLQGNPVHTAALTRSLESPSVTWIDTSPNYGDGAAEALIGQVLQQTKGKTHIQVCSKFGFIEGQTLEHHKSSGSPFQETTEFTDTCLYSLHHDFMRHQLHASLGRLGVDALDLYLIHNPEHYIMPEIPPNETFNPLANPETDAAARLLLHAREKLQDRLRRCFRTLEQEVANGTIRGYGISSNSFALPFTHPHFVPFDQLIPAAAQAAAEVGNTEHSFKAVQFPGNVLEREGLTPVHLGGNGCSQWAHRSGIQVFVNRPLSGFDRHGTWRFADFPFPLNYASAKEDLIDYLSPQMDMNALTGDERKSLEDTLEAAAWLKRLLYDLDGQIGSFTSILHYQHDFNNVIIPMLMEKLEAVDDETSAKLHAFFLEYERAVRSVTGMQGKSHVTEQLKQDAKAASESEPGSTSSSQFELSNPLGESSAQPGERFLPNIPGKDEAMQDYALSFLLRHPHVSTVLVGMSSPEQVDSVLNCVKELEKV